MSRGEELLRRQFEEGPLSPQEDEELQALLRDSAKLRARYARWLELERALEGRDIPTAQIERLVARGVPGSSATPLPQRRGWWLGGSVALLAAAAALLVVRSPSSPAPVGVRGGPGEGRLAWISVFQPPAAGRPPVPVDEEARADLPFAFAYTKLRGSPHRFLAIVGRDATGRVHWFHPAYTGTDRSPESLPIEAGGADVELGELVEVDAATGPFEICGLFTEEPLEVAQLDEALEAGEPWPASAERDCHRLTLGLKNGVRRGAGPAPGSGLDRRSSPPRRPAPEPRPGSPR